ncbi:MAG: ADP-ribose polymerase [Flexibacter sp. CG_4_10_14_3_um_filter_32_15]|nr:MAG: ADP-ribose polymerase [Flexibacter sp. CG_4_10_14_3_um_filter_32_15]
MQNLVLSSNNLQHSTSQTQPITTFKTAKLVMVTATNNNKYYEMRQISDDTFSVSYGRVGQGAAINEYSMYQWESKYREKVRKGYKDVTHLFLEELENKSSKNDSVNSNYQNSHNFLASWSAIKNGEVRELFRHLTQYAQRSIHHNYEVSAADVTMAQVEEAQTILDNLTKKVDFKSNKISKKALENFDTIGFNALLLELYSIIPRKMERVTNYLLEYTAGKNVSKPILQKARTILTNEQETLDVMRGEVELRLQQAAKTQIASSSKDTQSCVLSKSSVSNTTLLDALGIEVSILDEKKAKDAILIKRIKKMMQDEVGKFVNAYSVKDIAQEQIFATALKQSKYRTTELLWHGSRNENWLSILKTGLVLRPTNALITGKMFGYGLYFADKCRKSLNYTSLRGSFWTAGNDNKAFLAIYEVHTGRQLKIENYEPWCAGLTYENLKKQNSEADSLFAKGGVDLFNNEFIIYKENQCTIRYLVEVYY